MRGVEARVYFPVHRRVELKLALLFDCDTNKQSQPSFSGKKQLPLHVPAIHIHQLQPDGASILFCTGKPPPHRNIPHKTTSGNRELWAEETG